MPCNMKTIIKSLLLLAIPAILFCAFAVNSGCRTSKQHDNTPESVAVRFLQYMGKFEFEEARKISTEKTHRMLDMLDMLMDISKEQGKDSLLQKKDIHVEVTNVAIDKNVAVVKYKNETGQEQSIDLLKENGKWLVDLKKETPNLQNLPENFKIQNKRPDQNQTPHN
jgi:hypothetical protein